MDYVKEYQVLIGAVLISIAVLIGADNLATSIAGDSYWTDKKLDSISNSLSGIAEYLYDLVYNS